MATKTKGGKPTLMEKLSGMMKRRKPTEEQAQEPQPPQEAVFSATLFVSQILKEMVVLTLESKEGAMHQTRFTFDRSLLPKDYAFEEKRKYLLVVTRIK